MVISAAIGNGSQGNHNLIKAGAGTMVLSGSNTYTGNTTINDGTLELTSTGKMYNGGYTKAIVTINTGGTWRMPDYSYGGVGQLADYAEHRGERPIAVTWKLRREMPPQVLQESRAVS